LISSLNFLISSLNFDAITVGLCANGRGVAAPSLVYLRGSPALTRPCAKSGGAPCVVKVSTRGLQPPLTILTPLVYIGFAAFFTT
jgi:hypothetical protein